MVLLLHLLLILALLKLIVIKCKIKKMMMKPLVSIIIPFYKNKKWLGEALDSVSNQTYHNLEVLVIMDGSPEDCTDIIRKYSDYNFIKTENRGCAAARNLGIKLAKGSYITILDADDLWVSSKIQKQLSYMIKHGYKWCHTNYSRFFVNGLKANQKIDVTAFSSSVSDLFITCPIATPCVMIEANVLKQNKELRFEEDFEAGEDTLLWLRIAEKYELGVMDEYLSKVRMRGSNAMSNPILQLEFKSRLYSHIKQSQNLFPNPFYYYLVVFGFFQARFFYNLYQIIFHKFSILGKFENIIGFLFYAFPYAYLKGIYKVFNFNAWKTKYF